MYGLNYDIWFRRLALYFVHKLKKNNFFFADLHSRDRSRRNRHTHPQHALNSSALFSPFGLSIGSDFMDDFFNTGSGNFTSFSSINGTFNSGGSGSTTVKRTQTSTRFVNGKKIVTKK